jgi:hypothetical protein
MAGMSGLEIWRRLQQIGGYSSFIGALRNRCFVQIAAIIRPNSNAVNAASAHNHLSVAPNVLQTFRRIGFASVAQFESNLLNNHGRVRIQRSCSRGRCVPVSDTPVQVV